MDATTLYVRLEGVNLSNFIEDVHDLSTIRGGSFLLLDAVERVRRKFDLAPISTGASSGFFRSDGAETPETLRTRIEHYVRVEEKQLVHATIVVDVYATGEGFVHAREALTAMNRWRQFQQPTVAVPSRPEEAVQTECELDHRRPGVDRAKVGDDWKTVSASVKTRRDFGRDEKQHFYARELEKLPHDEALQELIAQLGKRRFARELSHITDDPSRGSLDGKMAIVYFDGNRFGRIQEACDSPGAQSAFDTAVKTYRRQALRALLAGIIANPDGWTVQTDQGEAIRLETLLWGGDELLWVVPAWKGWDVVRMFYDVSRDWELNEPLTHSGGIVFCHRAAPIHRMTHLAKDLAECCKEHIKRSELPDDHPSRDLFAYQVLESFDHIGTDLEAFRDTRVPKGRHRDELIVRGAAIGSVADDFDVVRKRFPRSKLHDIVLALRDGKDAAPLVTATVGDLDDATRAALKRLFASFAVAPPETDPWLAQPTVWFHILELWDYAITGANQERSAQ